MVQRNSPIGNKCMQFDGTHPNFSCKEMTDIPVELYSLLFQSRQNPQMPSELIKTKATQWKQTDTKELERRKAFYAEVLEEQRSVSSNGITCSCRSIECLPRFFIPAHVAHPDHFVRATESRAAGGDRFCCKPANNK